MAYAQGSSTKTLVQYTDDAGVHHSIEQASRLATWVGNSTAGTPGQAGKPAKWKLRHVIVQGSDAGVIHRKRIVICDSTNGVFTGATATLGAMDGISTWTVEGKIGERRQN